ncbi:MAG: TonB-dependent receptor plug domain-containing protein [Flavobacteriaceae bacterium]|nr:TonB-dependent receptor plug domain-containing protein [Flavobacteriaceae bacterium]
MKNHNTNSQIISNNLLLKILLVTITILFTSFININTSFKKNHSKNKFSSNIEPKEKVYLHLDKSFYTSGDDIWFKVYLVDGYTLQSNSLSKIVYVDLIDPNNKIVDTRTIKTEEGGGAGEFRLSEKLITGSYLIRAYTNYLRNFGNQSFFRKEIYVQSLSMDEALTRENGNNLRTDGRNVKPDLQFFPEGGTIVNTCSNRLGFKVLGVNGKGIDVTGAIIDENKNEIVKFKTSKFGLGRVLFMPERNKTYKAHIKYADQDYFYDLPKALNKGITMQVEDLPDHYQIIIQSSLDEGVNNLLLLGQQKEKIVGRAKIIGPEKASTINIPKSIFKQGIVQFTLLGKDEKPWCERLVFVEDHEDKTKVDITFSKNNYQKRELVEIDLFLNKNTQSVIQANLSLAITDMLVVKLDDYRLDIKSYLLLNSDLRGKIESPGYYFMSKEPQRKEVLDILMMTQGWRRFVVNETEIQNDIQSKYRVETGVSFKGNIKKFNNHNKISSEVTLLFRNKDFSLRDSVQTSNGGHFFLGDYNIIDSTTIIVQIVNINNKKGKKYKKNSKMNYYIEFDKFISPEVTLKSTSINKSNENYKNLYLERSKTMQLEGIYQDGNNFVQLDEVTLKPVTIKKKSVNAIKKQKLGTKHSESSHLISSEQLENAAEGNLITILESRIPGLSIQGNFITLRGYTTVFQNNYQKEPEKPLFLLDNIITDFDNIRDLRVETIDFVEVLKGSRAAIYGSRASHGVIAIYTKSATEKFNTPATEETFESEIKEKNEILRFVHSGYYKAREFYEPIYNTGESDYLKPDYRTTIYWSPNIEFNAQGKAKISFYTADITTTYRVELQGITSEGIPIKSEAFIEVK